jgi:hypothetical protein
VILFKLSVQKRLTRLICGIGANHFFGACLKRKEPLSFQVHSLAEAGTELFHYFAQSLPPLGRLAIPQLVLPYSALQAVVAIMETSRGLYIADNSVSFLLPSLSARGPSPAFLAFPRGNFPAMENLIPGGNYRLCDINTQLNIGTGVSPMSLSSL